MRQKYVAALLRPTPSSPVEPSFVVRRRVCSTKNIARARSRARAACTHSKRSDAATAACLLVGAPCARRRGGVAESGGMSWACDQAVQLLNASKLATDGASKLVRLARVRGASHAALTPRPPAARSTPSSSSPSCFSARSPRWFRSSAARCWSYRRAGPHASAARSPRVSDDCAGGAHGGGAQVPGHRAGCTRRQQRAARGALRSRSDLPSAGA